MRSITGVPRAQSRGGAKLHFCSEVAKVLRSAKRSAKWSAIK
jgi:hypothetical protein